MGLSDYLVIFFNFHYTVYNHYKIIIMLIKMSINNKSTPKFNNIR